MKVFALVLVAFIAVAAASSSSDKKSKNSYKNSSEKSDDDEARVVFVPVAQPQPMAQPAARWWPAQNPMVNSWPNSFMNQMTNPLANAMRNPLATAAAQQAQWSPNWSAADIAAYRNKINERLDSSAIFSEQPEAKKQIQKLLESKLDVCKTDAFGKGKADKACVSNLTAQIMQLIAAHENGARNLIWPSY